MIVYQTQKTRELQAREAERIMAGIDKAVRDAIPKEERETPLQFRKRAGDLTTS